MTELQALNKSIKLWKWLVKNFPKRKLDYPEYEEIIMYCAECPLCQKYIYDNVYDNVRCQGCCLNRLKKANKYDICCKYYYIWANNPPDDIWRDEKAGLKAAEKILDTMIKRRDEIRKN